MLSMLFFISFIVFPSYRISVWLCIITFFIYFLVFYMYCFPDCVEFSVLSCSLLSFLKTIILSFFIYFHFIAVSYWNIVFPWWCHFFLESLCFLKHCIDMCTFDGAVTSSSPWTAFSGESSSFLSGCKNALCVEWCSSGSREGAILNLCAALSALISNKTKGDFGGSEGFWDLHWWRLLGSSWSLFLPW